MPAVLNYPLVFLALLAGLLGDEVFADPCSFDESRRTYNATDLLSCLNNLAAGVMYNRQRFNNKPSIRIMSDRMFDDEEARQLFSSYAPDFSSNYFDDDAITSFLSGIIPDGLQNLGSGLQNLQNGLQGGLQNFQPGGLLPDGLQNGLQSLQSGLLPGGLQNGIPNLANLLNFNRPTRPNFNLYNALSTITQNDDLKCVPRILCEVASGSPPGSLSYRQNPGNGGNSIQEFGQNALFGLLTAFDSRGTSPLINFGKAALLGYANRGHSNMCYQAYSKCPSNPDQLISYLNNHNGGFFQFFNGKRGQYGHHPQQSTYYGQQYGQQPSYYKNQLESRIVGGSKKQEDPAPAEWRLGPEADRTGTGKLSFSNSEYYKKSENPSAAQTRDVESSIKFPKENRDGGNVQFAASSSGAHYVKSPQNIFNALNAQSDDVRTDRYRKDRKFFPQDTDGNREIRLGDEDQENYRRKPRYETFENRGESYVHFPPEYNQAPHRLLHHQHRDSATFSFPNNLRAF